jgi:hypothetical protein
MRGRPISWRSPRGSRRRKGGAIVGSAVTAMRQINTSSKKIADIIGVIDEIAFQTNLARPECGGRSGSRR